MPVRHEEYVFVRKLTHRENSCEHEAVHAELPPPAGGGDGAWAPIVGGACAPFGGGAWAALQCSSIDAVLRQPWAQPPLDISGPCPALSWLRHERYVVQLAPTQESNSVAHAVEHTGDVPRSRVHDAAGVGEAAARAVARAALLQRMRCCALERARCSQHRKWFTDELFSQQPRGARAALMARNQ